MDLVMFLIEFRIGIPRLALEMTVKDKKLLCTFKRDG